MKGEASLRPIPTILLVLACCGVIYAFFGPSPGFTDADIETVKAEIKKHYEKNDDIDVEVTDVALLRESKRKLVGYAKIKFKNISILPELTKACSATMSSSGKRAELVQALLEPAKGPEIVLPSYQFGRFAWVTTYNCLRGGRMGYVAMNRKITCWALRFQFNYLKIKYCAESIPGIRLQNSGFLAVI